MAIRPGDRLELATALKPFLPWGEGCDAAIIWGLGGSVQVSTDPEDLAKAERFELIVTREQVDLLRSVLGMEPLPRAGTTADPGLPGA